MGILITTDDLKNVAVRDRFGLWQDMVSANVLGQDIEYKSADGFLYGSVKTAELTDLLMAHVCCSRGQIVSRSKAQIKKTPDDIAILCLQVAGSAVLSAGNRQMRLAAGNWTLCDCRKIYTWYFSDYHGQLVLKIPKKKLYGRLNMPELVHGHVMSSNTGVGKITWSFLNAMWQELADSAQNLNPRFEDITLELVSAAINEYMCIPKEISLSGAVRLLEVKAYIHANLKDPCLYVESIAHALKISPRYLHLLFKHEQTTIAQYIRDLRLEKCARDLKDPHLSRRSITEIAYAWGFNSHANFSKLFRKHYHMSPKEFRGAAREA